MKRFLFFPQEEIDFTLEIEPPELVYLCFNEPLVVTINGTSNRVTWSQISGAAVSLVQGGLTVTLNFPPGYDPEGLIVLRATSIDYPSVFRDLIINTELTSTVLTSTNYVNKLPDYTLAKISIDAITPDIDSYNLGLITSTATYIQSSNNQLYASVELPRYRNSQIKLVRVLENNAGVYTLKESRVVGTHMFFLVDKSKNYIFEIDYEDIQSNIETSTTSAIDIQASAIAGAISLLKISTITAPQVEYVPYIFSNLITQLEAESTLNTSTNYLPRVNYFNYLFSAAIKAQTAETTLNTSTSYIGLVNYNSYLFTAGGISVG